MQPRFHCDQVRWLPTVAINPNVGSKISFMTLASLFLDMRGLHLRRQRTTDDCALAAIDAFVLSAVIASVGVTFEQACRERPRPVTTIPKSRAMTIIFRWVARGSQRLSIQRSNPAGCHAVPSACSAAFFAASPLTWREMGFARLCDMFFCNLGRIRYPSQRNLHLSRLFRKSLGSVRAGACCWEPRFCC